MDPVYRPSDDAAPQWRPRIHAGDDEPPVDQVARTLATTRRRAVAGLIVGALLGGGVRPAGGKPRKRRCGKGKKRCPDGKCYGRDKGCCPKRWGGGACWEAFPICCPPKPGHKRFSGCVADAAYCSGCGPVEVQCPPVPGIGDGGCYPSGYVCCPHGLPCPPDFPVCCPPSGPPSLGLCLLAGSTCP